MPQSYGSKKGKSKSFNLRAEFNMSAMYMERINNHLIEADRYAIECGLTKFNSLVPYIHTLWAIYRTIRPLMNDKIAGDYDNRIEDFLFEIYNNKKLNWKTFRELEVLHRDLVQALQIHNMGITATKDIKTFEKDLNEEYR